MSGTYEPGPASETFLKMRFKIDTRGMSPGKYPVSIAVSASASVKTGSTYWFTTEVFKEEVRTLEVLPPQQTRQESKPKHDDEGSKGDRCS